MNTFGKIFRISLFGESHGESVGILIDGCPPGIEFSEKELKQELERRKPRHYSSTGRKETDIPHIRSGINNGFTTGSPIMIEFFNKKENSAEYAVFKTKPRPGHIDIVALKKYKGYADIRGSGHFSGRLTLPLVCGGYFAKKILGKVEIKASILEIGGKKFHKDILSETFQKGDSLGGIIECRINYIEAGLGEPFFDSAESVISSSLFSIPGVKGVEFGAGFASASMKGSEYNDVFVNNEGRTQTNNCGGITGGISNGNELIFRVVFRPPSSISKKQNTIDISTNEITDLQIRGRHDAAPVLRCPVIVEAAAAVSLCDLKLRSNSG